MCIGEVNFAYCQEKILMFNNVHVYPETKQKSFYYSEIGMLRNWCKVFNFTYNHVFNKCKSHHRNSRYSKIITPSYIIVRFSFTSKDFRKSFWRKFIFNFAQFGCLSMGIYVMYRDWAIFSKQVFQDKLLLLYINLRHHLWRFLIELLFLPQCKTHIGGQ